MSGVESTFTIVAEPNRRAILSLLLASERSVGDLERELRLSQPSVSKHLRVLRDVGLVRMRCQGRQKLYRTNAEAIRPLHQWAATFERYWQHQLNRVKERAEETVRRSHADSSSPNPNPNSKPNPKA